MPAITKKSLEMLAAQQLMVNFGRAVNFLKLSGCFLIEHCHVIEACGVGLRGAQPKAPTCLNGPTFGW